MILGHLIMFRAAPDAERSAPQPGLTIGLVWWQKEGQVSIMRPGLKGSPAAVWDLVVRRMACASTSSWAGLTTCAAAAGVNERAIMQQTRHCSVNMARRYIRDGSLFRENAVAGVGL